MARTGARGQGKDGEEAEFAAGDGAEFAADVGRDYRRAMKPPAAFASLPSRRRGLLLLSAAMLSAASLVGCARSLPPEAFRAEYPTFEPDEFFLGKTHSWGVFEDASGANPTRRFTTRCVGRREKNGDLTLDQRFLYSNGQTQERHWRIHRSDRHRYEATANDVVGIARGEAYGRAFHWEYTVALKPGNPLFNVRLKQWMYGQEDPRTMLNRGTVSKFGVTIAQVTEQFQRGE